VVKINTEGFMAVVCPYCEIEISENALEAEGGCCPECGAIITPASSTFEDDEEGDEELDDLEDDDLEELDDLDEMEFDRDLDDFEDNEEED